MAPRLAKASPIRTNVIRLPGRNRKLVAPCKTHQHRLFHIMKSTCLIPALCALFLTQLSLRGADNTLTAEQKADGWISLFDGSMYSQRAMSSSSNS